jgi:hypothetical protein
MLSIKHHVEYLAEAVADARAVKVVEARRVLKEAKARLTQARLCAELTPSFESRRALLEAEHACLQAARAERLTISRDVSRS